MIFFLFTICAALSAFLPAYIAKAKGKEFGTWYLYGFFFWPVAVFHAILLPEATQTNTPSHPRPHAVEPYYDRLQKIDLADRVDLYCPIDILKYEIMENKQKLYLNLWFFNRTAKQVSALMLVGTACDSFGNKILVEGSDTMQLLAQDMGSNANRQFTCVSPILLPHMQIREMSLAIAQIRYADGEIVKVLQHQFVEPEIEQFWTKGEKEAAQSILYHAVCYPVEYAAYWICACGRANLPHAAVCSACGIIKQEVFEKITKEQVKAIAGRNQKARELQEQYCKE